MSLVLRLRSRLAVFLAIGFASCSDGAPMRRDAGTSRPTSDASAPMEMKEFSSVTLTIDNGLCSKCFRRLTVARGGIFLGVDSDGMLQTALPEAELGRVLELVSSQEYVAAFDAANPECLLASDVEVGIEARWQGEETAQRATVSNGCAGLCDRPEHPLMRLKVLLFELKERHFDCGPARLRSLQYCSQVPEPPPLPLPLGRMLCAACSDDCGVPIPEGVRMNEDICAVECTEDNPWCLGDCPDAGP